MMFVKGGGLAREKRAERSTMDNKIWLSMHQRNFGSDKIVFTTYVPYVHTLHVHPINVDNRERARARNKKKTTRPSSLEEKSENAIALLQNRRNTVAAT